MALLIDIRTVHCRSDLGLWETPLINDSHQITGDDVNTAALGTGETLQERFNS